MRKELNQVVVITGASSGIGEATAGMLAKSRAKIVAVARRKSKLDKLVKNIEASEGRAIAIKADVTSYEDMQRVAKTAQETYGRLDVWVNNAGVMPLAPVEMNRIDEWNWMVDVNIKGVLNGVAAAQPIMREQGSGQFVNISSVAGHHVYKGCAVYCATKFAVRAFSEGIRKESDGTIRVTNISPGSAKSDLFETIGVPEIRKDFEGLSKIAIDADAVACAIHFAVTQPADVDINEITIRPAEQEL